MKLSELIKQLEALREKHGDLPVRVQSMSHRLDPEPVVQRKPTPFVLLNP